MCIYIYIYTYTHMEHGPSPWDFFTDTGSARNGAGAVGFHNFNLRIFNLRVSNPNKLIVNIFFDTMSDFNVPGSRPKEAL